MASSRQKPKKPPIPEILKRPKRSKGKFEKPQGGPWGFEDKDLRNTMVFDAAVDSKGKIVCPNCGLYKARSVDYNYSPERYAHLGKYQFVVICQHCNTLFTYYRSI